MSTAFHETEQRVWGCNTRVQFQSNFGIQMSGINLGAEGFRRLSSFASRGRPFERSHLPVMHQISDVDGSFSILPEFFYFNFYYASERILDVFMEFDLGDTVVQPVTILDQKGQAPMGQYSIIATQNQKTCLLPELSDEVMENEFGLFEKYPAPKDDSICFDSSALSGPDIFHVDRFEGLYLSHGLVDRLRATGLARYFHLYRVRVVSQV